MISDWDSVKKVDDYEAVAGKLLFQNLFEKCPEAKPLFGFPMTMDPKSPALLKSPRFVKHADFLVAMVEKTVGMLGGGLNQELTGMLHELGRKHVAYGVKPDFFSFMTDSLLAMLVEVIGKPNEVAWQDVFDFLIANMEAGHRRIDKDVSAKKDKVKCITVWSKLRTVKKYKEQGGIILFQKYVLSPSMDWGGYLLTFGMIDLKSPSLLLSPTVFSKPALRSRSFSDFLSMSTHALMNCSRVSDSLFTRHSLWKW